MAQRGTLLAGEQRFFGITAPGLSLEGCDMHQRLLVTYAKVRAAQA